MSTTLIAVLVVVGVIVVALIVWAAVRARRTTGLKQTFGPEYDRTVTETGGRRAAESELEARRERRARLEIRPLTTDARERYGQQWRLVQERFVEHPVQAVREADVLVQQVMADRGYPTDDFEQRSADISVDHPQLVDEYRAAHGISMASDRGKASTEDLREAMLHYRALFTELLGESAA